MITVTAGTPIRCNRCEAKFAAPSELNRWSFCGQAAARIEDMCSCPECQTTDGHWVFASDVMPEFDGSNYQKQEARKKWLRVN